MFLVTAFLSDELGAEFSIVPAKGEFVRSDGGFEVSPSLVDIQVYVELVGETDLMAIHQRSRDLRVSAGDAGVESMSADDLPVYATVDAAFADIANRIRSRS